MPKFNVIARKGVKFIPAINGNEAGMNAAAVVLGATKMLEGEKSSSQKSEAV